MSSILQALLGASQQEYQQDPFLQGARGLNSIDQSQYDMSPAQRILFGALQGLGGGFAKGVGESRVENKMLDRSNKLMEAQKQGKIYEALLEDPQMASFAPLYQMEQEAAKTERLQELNKALLPKGMMLDEAGGVKQLWDPIQQEVDKAGRIKEAELLAARKALPDTLGQGLEEKDPEGMFGEYATTKSKRQSLIREGISMGLTPNAAQEYADKNLTTSTAMNKEAVKKIEAARSRANKLGELAAVAEAGIQGAGQTGGPLWGLRNAISSAYSLVSPEETEQRKAQALLESVEPDIIAASRPAGVGAMSDREMKSYLGAGPSSAKLPAENQALTEKMKNVAAIEQEYADFLESYLEDKGDAIGADKAWAEYKAANPILVDGEWNRNRTPWTEYFQKRGGSPQARLVEESLPVETRMVGGQPVRVRRLPDGTYEEVE